MDWFEVKIPGETDGIIVKAQTSSDAIAKALDRFEYLPQEASERAICKKHVDQFIIDRLTNSRRA